MDRPAPLPPLVRWHPAPYRSTMGRRAVLALCAAQLVRHATASGAGFCLDGQCINCIYCDGDCYSRCTCYSEINVCCCASPPGYFTRGYEKNACPGGTYQNAYGSVSCKPCNSDPSVLYNIHYRGSVDILECQDALCSTVCSPDNATCQGKQCDSAPSIMKKLSQAPVDQGFCDSLVPRIPTDACTWIVEDGARRPVGVSFAALASLALAWLHIGAGRAAAGAS
mmetsp:Transcript_17172/g.49051  ORF Transcript_17172/g.49051 Transcript_17172/m.49051 type:complete len:224 (-) Transcript_17172:106-777(-)